MAGTVGASPAATAGAEGKVPCGAVPAGSTDQGIAGGTGDSRATGRGADRSARAGDQTARGCRTTGRGLLQAAARVGSQTGQVPDRREGIGARAGSYRAGHTARQVGSQTREEPSGAGDAAAGIGGVAQPAAGAAGKFPGRTIEARNADNGIAPGAGQSGTAGQEADGNFGAGEQASGRGRA